MNYSFGKINVIKPLQELLGYKHKERITALANQKIILLVSKNTSQQEVLSSLKLLMQDVKNEIKYLEKK